MGRPRITARLAPSGIVRDGSARTRIPPCPLAEIAMFPLMRKASPPNIFFSVTPVWPASSSRRRDARSSS